MFLDRTRAEREFLRGHNLKDPPMKTILLAAAAALAMPVLALPASAQAVIETPTGTAVAVPPGAPGVVTRQTGSTGAPGAINVSPTGQPADVISNDSAAAGNAGQPSRVAPQGGGGGR